MATAPIPKSMFNGSGDVRIVAPGIVMVFPDGARKLLEASDEQSAVLPATIARYGRAILNGEWQSPKHEIVLYPDGSVASGHEYLQGIVRAGIPAKLYFEQGGWRQAELKVVEESRPEPLAVACDDVVASDVAMVTTVETITPDVARAYLEANRKNRKLKQHKVDAYAREMTAGNWKLNHQSIAFDVNGNLADGQHRLRAVIKSGVTIRSNVTRGEELSAGTTVDIGAPRSDVDLASALGVGVNFNEKESAVAKAMRPCHRNGKSSRQESLRFTISHLDAIRFAAAAARSNEAKNAVVRSVIARAYYTVDHEILQRFGEVVAKGHAEGPHESAAVALRNLIARDKQILHTQVNRHSLLLKTANALRAFIDGRPLVKVAEAKSMLFLLPGEKEKD